MVRANSPNRERRGTIVHAIATADARDAKESGNESAEQFAVGQDLHWHKAERRFRRAQ